MLSQPWRVRFLAVCCLIPALPQFAWSQGTQLTVALVEGRQFTAEQAAAAEAAANSDFNDVVDRVRLLGYYWPKPNQNGQNEANRAARLGLILWLVEHHPELSILTSPFVAIPATEAAAYEQVQQAWRQSIATHANDAQVLGNAAKFYRISDKQQSVDLLHRALVAHPRDARILTQLGDEDALILLGITALDPAGRAVQADSAQAHSPLANIVRAELEAASQAPLLYAAGNALKDYSSQLVKPGSPPSQTDAWAANLIQRAEKMDGAKPPARIRVGGDVQAFNLIVKVDPVYPPLARQARIQGTVRFSVTIAKDGTVANLQLVSGHPLLVAAAQDAVKQWVYKPTLLNGAPVEVATQVDVNFTLSPAILAP